MTGLYGNPKRTGKVGTWGKFDAQFFGIPPKQVNYMDPQLRNLLHTAYEAISDAGVNPLELRGSKTGVFVGCSGSETVAALTTDPDKVSGYSLSGCLGSMFANRLSFSFDLRGPSFAIDTACNSSLLALQLAISSIRDRQCTAALVCGANATLTATNCLQFARLGILAPDGACRSFDADGKGYGKSEGVAVLLLQQAADARRVYATAIHAKSSCDGWKEEGVHFPSGQAQLALLREVYDESGVHPTNVSYMEAHGTGTKVGDPQEVNSIAQLFCPPEGRDQPLLLGSVKSNMGHAETCSGLASVAKVILAMEQRAIPPNLHFRTPNPNIPCLTDGRVTVVDRTTPWAGGLAGINSFGFGGANTHVLLRSHDLEPTLSHQLEPDAVPKLFCFASRTEAGLGRVFDALTVHSDNHAFYSLLARLAQAPVHQLPHRGFLLLNPVCQQSQTRHRQRVPYEPPPLWLVFTGMGAQWFGMGKDLIQLPVFRNSVLESSEAIRHLGCDPYRFGTHSFLIVVLPKLALFSGF